MRDHLMAVTNLLLCVCVVSKWTRAVLYILWLTKEIGHMAMAYSQCENYELKSLGIHYKLLH